MVSRKSYKKKRYSRKTNKKHRNRSLKKRKMARKTRKNRLKYVMKGGEKVIVTFNVESYPITIAYESDDFPEGRDSAETILMRRYSQIKEGNSSFTPQNFVKWLERNMNNQGFRFQLVNSSPADGRPLPEQSSFNIPGSGLSGSDFPQLPATGQTFSPIVTRTASMSKTTSENRARKRKLEQREERLNIQESISENTNCMPQIGDDKAPQQLLKSKIEADVYYKTQIVTRWAGNNPFELEQSDTDTDMAYITTHDRMMLAPISEIGPWRETEGIQVKIEQFLEILTSHIKNEDNKNSEKQIWKENYGVDIKMLEDFGDLVHDFMNEGTLAFDINILLDLLIDTTSVLFNRSRERLIQILDGCVSRYFSGKKEFRSNRIFTEWLRTQMGNDPKTVGKTLEEIIKTDVYDTHCFNKFLINPGYSTRDGLHAQAILKWDLLSQEKEKELTRQIMSYGTGDPVTGAKNWREILGHGNNLLREFPEYKYIDGVLSCPNAGDLKVILKLLKTRGLQLMVGNSDIKVQEDFYNLNKEKYKAFREYFELFILRIGFYDFLINRQRRTLSDLNKNQIIITNLKFLFFYFWEHNIKASEGVIRIFEKDFGNTNEYFGSYFNTLLRESYIEIFTKNYFSGFDADLEYLRQIIFVDAGDGIAKSINKLYSEMNARYFIKRKNLIPLEHLAVCNKCDEATSKIADEVEIEASGGNLKPIYVDGSDISYNLGKSAPFMVNYWMSEKGRKIETIQQILDNSNIDITFQIIDDLMKIYKGLLNDIRFLYSEHLSFLHIGLTVPIRIPGDQFRRSDANREEAELTLKGEILDIKEDESGDNDTKYEIKLHLSQLTQNNVIFMYFITQICDRNLDGSIVYPNLGLMKNDVKIEILDITYRFDGGAAAGGGEENISMSDERFLKQISGEGEIDITKITIKINKQEDDISDEQFTYIEGVNAYIITDKLTKYVKQGRFYRTKDKILMKSHYFILNLLLSNIQYLNDKKNSDVPEYIITPNIFTQLDNLNAKYNNFLTETKAETTIKKHPIFSSENIEKSLSQFLNEQFRTALQNKLKIFNSSSAGSEYTLKWSDTDDISGYPLVEPIESGEADEKTKLSKMKMVVDRSPFYQNSADTTGKKRSNVSANIIDPLRINTENPTKFKIFKGSQIPKGARSTVGLVGRKSKNINTVEFIDEFIPKLKNKKFVSVENYGEDSGITEEQRSEFKTKNINRFIGWFCRTYRGFNIQQGPGESDISLMDLIESGPEKVFNLSCYILEINIPELNPEEDGMNYNFIRAGKKNFFDIISINSKKHLYMKNIDTGDMIRDNGEIITVHLNSLKEGEVPFTEVKRNYFKLHRKEVYGYELNNLLGDFEINGYELKSRSEIMKASSEKKLSLMKTFNWWIINHHIEGKKEGDARDYSQWIGTKLKSIFENYPLLNLIYNFLMFDFELAKSETIQPSRTTGSVSGSTQVSKTNEKSEKELLYKSQTFLEDCIEEYKEKEKIQSDNTEQIIRLYSDVSVAAAGANEIPRDPYPIEWAQRKPSASTIMKDIRQFLACFILFNNPAHTLKKKLKTQYTSKAYPILHPKNRTEAKLKQTDKSLINLLFKSYSRIEKKPSLLNLINNDEVFNAIVPNYPSRFSESGIVNSFIFLDLEGLSEFLTPLKKIVVFLRDILRINPRMIQFCLYNLLVQIKKDGFNFVEANIIEKANACIAVLLRHKTEGDEMQLQWQKTLKYLYPQDSRNRGNQPLYFCFTYDGMCAVKAVRKGSSVLFQKGKGCCISLNYSYENNTICKVIADTAEREREDAMVTVDFDKSFVPELRSFSSFFPLYINTVSEKIYGEPDETGDVQDTGKTRKVNYFEPCIPYDYQLHNWYTSNITPMLEVDRQEISNNPQIRTLQYLEDKMLGELIGASNIIQFILLLDFDNHLSMPLDEIEIGIQAFIEQYFFSLNQGSDRGEDDEDLGSEFTPPPSDASLDPDNSPMGEDDYDDEGEEEDGIKLIKKVFGSIQLDHFKEVTNWIEEDSINPIFKYKFFMIRDKIILEYFQNKFKLELTDINIDELADNVMTLFCNLYDTLLNLKRNMEVDTQVADDWRNANRELYRAIIVTMQKLQIMIGTNCDKDFYDLNYDVDVWNEDILWKDIVKLVIYMNELKIKITDPEKILKWGEYLDLESYIRYRIDSIKNMMKDIRHKTLVAQDVAAAANIYVRDYNRAIGLQGESYSSVQADRPLRLLQIDRAKIKTPQEITRMLQSYDEEAESEDSDISVDSNSRGDGPGDGPPSDDPSADDSSADDPSPADDPSADDAPSAPAGSDAAGSGSSTSLLRQSSLNKRKSPPPAQPKSKRKREGDGN